ncbi:MAG TPA: hypothetical protein VKV27_15970 [Solirubrobacteraceae bacterium]|nr:hypothetical protein [Solirubrobacteraceae bacterium]
MKKPSAPSVPRPRALTAALAATITLAAIVAPGSAAAEVIELGAVASAPVVAPTCPSGAAAASCNIILEQTTAVQTVTNGTIAATTVKKPGWIVAFTVGLSKLSSDAKTELAYIHGLDLKYHGTPQLMLTVLKPGKRNAYTVVAQSGIYHLIPFLGQVLQEPMSLPPTFTAFTALPVAAGDVIGITVPTWAPILSYNLSTTKYAYRQSRTQNCIHPAGSQTAQLTIGETQRYGCDYTGTRVQYTATEIVDTPYPATYVGGPAPKPTPKPKPKKTVRRGAFARQLRLRARRPAPVAIRGLGGAAGGAPLVG